MVDHPNWQCCGERSPSTPERTSGSSGVYFHSGQPLYTFSENEENLGWVYCKDCVKKQMVIRRLVHRGELTEWLKVPAC